MSQDIRILNIETAMREPNSLSLHEANPNRGDLESIIESFRQNGFWGRVVVDKRSGKVLAGNHRVMAARELGMAQIPVEIIETDSDAHALRVLASDNRTARLGSDDETTLAALLKEIQEEQGTLEGTGYDDAFLSDLLSELESQQQNAEDAASEEQKTQAKATLAARFGVPPFSVLDARQGYWQERKRAWHAFGMFSEIGRDDNITYSNSCQSPAMYELRTQLIQEWGRTPSWPEIIEEAKKRGMNVLHGTSGFDPVLCELAYRWFCPEGGKVLDPFSGGVTRGAMAALLGREYVGLDLNPKQISANIETWPRVKEAWGERGIAHEPTWINGDSTQLESLLTQQEGIGADWQADYIFSCPPYAGLEIYSDDPRDLSRMDYADFRAGYRAIIHAAAARLKENRFACFVIGSCRDPKEGEHKGCLLPFIEDTVEAFTSAGCSYYNDAILLTPFGSLPIRVNAQFGKYRKLGRTHQYVQVFYKGDPQKIPDILGATEFGDLSVEEGEEGVSE
jgi:ParB-like chromosome segregation protein Spo0J